MYKLFIANKNYSSWSLRPWVLLSELQLPFEEQLMPFRSGPSANWAAFRAFSPNGKVPCLHDGETVVWDSLAIAEYLAERHEGVWPADPQARAWARCAAAEMHAGFPALRSQCSMNCGVRVQLRGIDDALKRDLDRVQALWNEGLSRFGGPFLAGPGFGAVDAFYAPVVFRIQTYALPFDAAAHDYVQRLLALPSMRHWYAAALEETWRDSDHERELLSLGTLREDLRS